MTKTTSILWMATALTMSAAPATAQTTKNIFVDVNAGVQVASRSFVVDAFPIVYGEAAILSTSHKIGSAGLFDVSGGYRVWRDLSIGLGFSYAGGSTDADMTAAVPHPLFHDQRVETKATVDAKHSEKTFHLQAIWTIPVTDKMDASFSVGPSFITANQDLVTGITVVPGTQDATPALETQSDTAAGFNIGADLTYLLNPRYGVGGFIRYVGGSVDLPSAENLKLGGFQIGGGARFRF
jgi:hypothetical protein